MTPAQRMAALERLDRVVRERNTWHDLRALGAYEDLWEIAYGMAYQAAEQDQSLAIAEERRRDTEGPAYTAADVEAVAEVSRRQLGASSIRWRDREHAREILDVLTLNGRRLVGPWEPAERPACPTCTGPIRETVGMVCPTCGTDYAPVEQPDPLADDPVGRHLGLVDNKGRTLCRCLAGAPDCTHRPAEQSEGGAPSSGGT